MDLLALVTLCFSCFYKYLKSESITRASKDLSCDVVDSHHIKEKVRVKMLSCRLLLVDQTRECLLSFYPSFRLKGPRYLGPS